MSNEVKRKRDINNLIQSRGQILAKVRQSLQQLAEVCKFISSASPSENVLKFKINVPTSMEEDVSPPERMEEDGI